MLVNKGDVEVLITTALNNALDNITVVQSRQTDWRGDNEYCVYTVLPFEDISRSKLITTKNQDETYTLTQKLVQSVEVTIDLVGKEAFNNYNLLKRRLFDDDVDFGFLALQDFEEVAVDNTALEKGEWLERATGGFVFRFNNEFSRTVSTIETVKDIDYIV